MRPHNLTAAGAAILCAALTLIPAPAFATTVTDQLTSAEELVDQLNTIGWPAESAYNLYCGSGCSGSVVTWGTPGSPTSYANDSQCAPFVTKTLEHTYSWATSGYFNANFGSTSPSSVKYYNAFANNTAGAHFTSVSPSRLTAGDIIAINYEQSSPTGHTAIVRSVSTTTSDIAGETEYLVQVVDSTDNPHGVAPVPGGYGDTRDSGSTEYAGAGYGYLVFYATPDDHWYGYRWGTNESAVHLATSRPIAAAEVTE